MKPLISVCLITYNHVQFIEKSLKGVLMQQANFPWELVVADDGSTDGTRDILLTYQRKYPDKIRLILQKKNIGAGPNHIQLITGPNSKYIALLDGDDYWTDPLKLQKQIDFLEANDDYNICVHNSNIINLEGKIIDNFSNRPHRLGVQASKSQELTKETILLANAALFHTSSYVLRKNTDYEDNLRAIANTKIRSGDFVILFTLLETGRCYYLGDICSSYRVHEKGITKSCTDTIKVCESYIMLYEFFIDRFPSQYRSIFEYQIAKYQYQIAESNYAKIQSRWYSRFTWTYLRVRAAKAKWLALKQQVKKQFSCVE